jgi:hypothetical protein
MNLGPPEGLPPKEAKSRGRSSSRGSNTSGEAEKRSPKTVNDKEVTSLDTRAESNSDGTLAIKNEANDPAAETREQVKTENQEKDKVSDEDTEAPIPLKSEPSNEEKVAQQNSKALFQNDEHAEDAEVHPESSLRRVEDEATNPSETPKRSGSSVAHRSSIFGGQVLRKTKKNKGRDASIKEERAPTLKDETTSSDIKESPSPPNNEGKSDSMEGISKWETGEEKNDSSVEAMPHGSNESKDAPADTLKTETQVSAESTVNQAASENKASNASTHLADSEDNVNTNFGDSGSTSLGTGDLKKDMNTKDEGIKNSGKQEIAQGSTEEERGNKKGEGVAKDSVTSKATNVTIQANKEDLTDTKGALDGLTTSNLRNGWNTYLSLLTKNTRYR